MSATEFYFCIRNGICPYKNFAPISWTDIIFTSDALLQTCIELEGLFFCDITCLQVNLYADRWFIFFSIFVVDQKRDNGSNSDRLCACLVCCMHLQRQSEYKMHMKAAEKIRKKLMEQVRLGR